MALPKKKPVNPGLTVAVGIGKPKGAMADDIPGPKPVDDEEDQPQVGGGAKPDMEQEPDGDECQPDPEAVCFRSEAETCGHCNYMQGDRCSHPIVAMPVGPGDSCNAFMPKQGGEQPAVPGQQAEQPQQPQQQQQPVGEQS